MKNDRVVSLASVPNFHLYSRKLGWMRDDLPFYVLFALFQTYQDDGRVIMNGCVQ